jgi:hypothetical protein
MQTFNILWVIYFIVTFIMISFTIASGIILILYGEKISKNTITEDDIKAGQFMIVLGVFGLIGFLTSFTSLIFKYKDLNKTQMSSLIINLSFSLATGIISIIYGNKIIKNEITAEDKQAGEFILVIGYFQTILASIVMLIFLLFSITTLIFVNKTKAKLNTTLDLSDDLNYKISYNMKRNPKIIKKNYKTDNINDIIKLFN